ncbi:MAG: PTS sugar transporter subunit IIA [Myxococcota bacterium]|nr:PTS sugar transporter subunit IIA [Myxococcota bacterium]
MAVGLVIVTHCNLGTEFLRALRLIVPDSREFQAISLDPEENLEAIRKKIRAAIKAADEDHGVLILTDMFGGTPSNVALSFLEEQHVEVVTGMNLPMLVKLAGLNDQKSLEEMATTAKDYGQRNISVASQLLPGEGSA